MQLTFSYERIIAIGDMEGDISPISTHLTQLHSALLIQLGDFCSKDAKLPLGLSTLDLQLQDIGSKLVVLRGNHDLPELFSSDQHFFNIHFVPDYTLLTLPHASILAIGGALSLDMPQKKCGVDFCIDKIPASSVDLLATHSFPRCKLPRPLARVKNTQLQAAIDQEDLALLQIYQHLSRRPKGWIFGHFHASYENVIDGECSCLGIGAGGIREIHLI